MDTVQQASHVVSVAEALRIASDLSHEQFTEALGRDRTEWAHLRAARRDPSQSFIRALRSYAAQVGGIWLSKVEVAIQQDALARAVA